MLSNYRVKTRRFDNRFRNLIISKLIGQFNLVMVENYVIVIAYAQGLLQTCNKGSMPEIISLTVS